MPPAAPGRSTISPRGPCVPAGGRPYTMPAGPRAIQPRRSGNAGGEALGPPGRTVASKVHIHCGNGPALGSGLSGESAACTCPDRFRSGGGGVCPVRTPGSSSRRGGPARRARCRVGRGGTWAPIVPPVPPPCAHPHRPG